MKNRPKRSWREEAAWLRKLNKEAPQKSYGSSGCLYRDLTWERQHRTIECVLTTISCISVVISVSLDTELHSVNFMAYSFLCLLCLAQFLLMPSIKSGRLFLWIFCLTKRILFLTCMEKLTTCVECTMTDGLMEWWVDECWVTHLLGRLKQISIYPKTEPTTDQSNDYSKAQLGESTNLLGLLKVP